MPSGISLPWPAIDWALVRSCRQTPDLKRSSRLQISTECYPIRPARYNRRPWDVVEHGTTSRAVPSVQLLPVQFNRRRVGVLSVDSPGARDEWEIHPEQDELLYLLEGTVDIFLRGELEAGEEQIVHLRQGEACVVRRECGTGKLSSPRARCCS